MAWCLVKYLCSESVSKSSLLQLSLNSRVLAAPVEGFVMAQNADVLRGCFQGKLCSIVNNQILYYLAFLSMAVFHSVGANIKVDGYVHPILYIQIRSLFDKSSSHGKKKSKDE